MAAGRTPNGKLVTGAKSMQEPSALRTKLEKSLSRSRAASQETDGLLDAGEEAAGLWNSDTGLRWRWSRSLNGDSDDDDWGYE